MINTVQIKHQQLTKGFFTIGSGPDVILIMGSCRVAPYVEYLHQWNLANGNRFTIHSIDPFNFNWNINDDRVDYIGALKEQESNQQLLAMLKSVKWFIHEYYQNAGMFNCDKSAAYSIYSFGMSPEIDVCIPNWNDLFVLAGDVVAFNLEMRKKAIQDFNVMGKLSDATKKEILELSQNDLRKFQKICYLSDLEEMGRIFLDNWLTKRYWWSYNHVSKHFTLAVFKLMNDKFLHLDLSKGFDENHADMFANNYTKLTDLDIELYNLQWGEEVIKLKTKLF